MTGLISVNHGRSRYRLVDALYAITFRVKCGLCGRFNCAALSGDGRGPSLRFLGESTEVSPINFNFSIQWGIISLG